MMSALLLDHLEEVESFVRTVADGLVDGEIPEMVPLVGGRIVAEKQLVAAVDGLTATVVPADVRDEVVAAIGSRSERDALISTALSALRASLQTLSAELAAGGDVDVDLVDALAVVSGQDREDVAAHARPVRQLVAWAPSASRYAGLALLLGGGAALVALHRRRRGRVPAVVGLGLVSAGVAVWVGWVLLSRAVGSPLRDAVASSGRGTVPDGAERLLGDIDRAVLTDVAHAWARPAMTLVVLGAATVGLSVVTLLWARLTSSGRRRVVGAVLTSAVATLAMNVTVQRGEVKAERRCNGHAELCDRRYDQIVQVATHNSMSSPDVVRVWPEHDGDIRQQLDFGVRTLMIDATYWRGVDDAPLRSLRQFVGSNAGDSVIAAIESRLAPRPGIYLCHSQCALGAMPMTTALAEVKGFLDDHPDEVVTLMIQDAVAPSDVAAAFASSGLDDMLYRGDPGDEWPTLGELIHRGQRLVVFSEQHVPPPAWYLSAFQHIQDTPYGARAPDELSCARNRGPRDAPLFLMNNWIEREAPDRAAAAVVNAKAFIVERARRCERARGKLPNFIAVSFYGIGDVMGAVDELNGVTPAD
jgi:hypothetical protein